MTTADIDEIKELLSLPKKVVITSHLNPDGDAMGSSLALYHFLIQLNHTVQVVVPSSYPDFLHWLPGNKGVVVYSQKTEEANQYIASADLLFALDFNTPKRVGRMEDSLVGSNATKILIDHHPYPDDFAKYVLSETSASSTAELIFDFIEMLGEKSRINKDVAECIYTGILTDTGSFSYGSTTVKAHKVAGEMIACGADNLKVQAAIFQRNSLDRVRLLGYSLHKNLTLLENFNAGYFALSRKELNRFKFKAGDTEGLVNYALSVKDIHLAVLMLEREDNYVKMSFRSTGKFPANELASKYFNGGGHRNAAGGEFHGSLKEAVKKLAEVLQNFQHGLSK